MTGSAHDGTHDPKLRSWVASANEPGSDFPVQNLPFGSFRRRGRDETLRCGVAIGDRILDIGAALAAGAFPPQAERAAAAAAGPVLNALMELGPGAWSLLRAAFSHALREGSPHERELEAALVPMAAAELALPMDVGDYTDFYASIYHATAVGALLRPDEPLLPNYKWLPVAYHGRASTVVISGSGVRRPVGQTMPSGAQTPFVGPSKRLDYELEVGIVVGVPNALGDRVAIEGAERHLFGLCLLNDWSARDVQGWEYRPLGPFLAKNFATTISPWIVTMEALEPYRAGWQRNGDDPQPLPYLDCADLRTRGAIDLQLEVRLETAAMRAAGQAPVQLSRSNFRDCYWTVSQMLAHHTVNGCALRSGDLFGSGTQSGPAPEEAGSLLELTQAGRRPLVLPNGERRAFLEDGDRVMLRGWCEKRGAARIGFGEASGTILPARA
jgi:fumarylacetoacetase